MANADSGSILRVAFTTSGTAAFLTVAGEVDASSFEVLAREIRRTLATDATEVIVDMSDVSFIDSSGLRALIFGYKAAEDRGATIRVQHASPSVVRLLQLTGLYDRFVTDPEKPEMGRNG